jgi:uncharacterized membrane protein YfcA
MWFVDSLAALSWSTLALVWLGAFVGGFASGAAGFALGIVASAIWLHVIEPVHATMLIVCGGTLIQLGTVWPQRRAIDPRRLWPFLAAGLVGIPIGVALLVHTDTQALKAAVGLFLAAYGVFALTAPPLPQVGGGRLADAAVGFVGGVMGGLGGLSGVLPAIWTQLRGWPKEVARAVYQPFIVVAHVATLVLIGAVALDRRGVVLLALALPALVIGALAGWHVYGRLDEQRFRQALAVLLVVSGLILVF